MTDHIQLEEVRDIRSMTEVLDSLDASKRPSEIDMLGHNAEIYSFDYLPAEACDALVQLLRTVRFQQSEVFEGGANGFRCSGDVFLHDIDKDLHSTFLRYSLPLLQRLTVKIWGWRCTSISDPGIVVYKKDQYYKEHIDAAVSRLHSMRHISFVIYLTDNFVGGETFFRRQLITVSPRKGWGVIFPAGITHPHEAKQVVSGEKYVITGWLSRE
jgi:hypothetical protein